MPHFNPTEVEPRLAIFEGDKSVIYRDPIMAQVLSQFTLIKIQGSSVNPILLLNLWLMPKVTQS